MSDKPIPEPVEVEKLKLTLDARPEPIKVTDTKAFLANLENIANGSVRVAP